ncbi:hypothetical protein FNV43_RR24492 [Rhamnella rubrinervis]|uniref:Ubiquitin-like protease family profile domain-containing protein n=1 Tax=Rhamnella rubrinervis TaxID=2594499 RepID=A0A8K0GT78_9ROSA|nr:hypothetical protein FNV43_RR24492 [Rhamnella rubrinervis]
MAVLAQIVHPNTDLPNCRSDRPHCRSKFLRANNTILALRSGRCGLPFGSMAGRTCHLVVNRLAEHDKKYHAHLTNNSNLDRAIDVIKNKLSNGMDKLLASWIGKFFEIKTVQFCGGFIHHLLLHQVECDDKYVMEFDFNGIGARFDRKCFAMITGLNCGKFPHDLELDHLPYDLWTKFFGKRGPMTQGEFSKAFEDLDLMRRSCDNVKSFTYPWGNLSYDATIASLRSRIKRGHEIANYDKADFLSVSIWGFKTIPIVATIGPRGKYHGSNWIPRMLAWSCPSILQYTKLATTIFDRKDYTVKNELQPTKEELQQTYMKTFWHRPSDRKYYGLPVFRVEASKSQLLVLPQLPIDGTKDASQSAFQHTSRLEMQIEEIRRELPLSNMSVVPVWDPFTPIDPAERAALSAFIDDPSTTVHPGDYDALEKSSFQLILTSGSWLGDLSSIHARYIKYLKKQSKHRVGDEEEDELSDTVDWEKEMKDSPFDMYALGTLPIGSKSWLDVDYVYVPVNNDNKHWLAAKVDIQNRTVTLYDPNNSMTQDSFQCKNAKCLSVLFPYLLMVHGYYDLYPELKVEGNSNLEPFDIKRESATNVPQQKISEDRRRSVLLLNLLTARDLRAGTVRCGPMLLHHFVWSNTGLADWQRGPARPAYWRGPPPQSRVTDHFVETAEARTADASRVTDHFVWNNTRPHIGERATAGPVTCILARRTV